MKRDSNHESRTIAIIQARMSSSRLPGKVLLDLAGQPMLARVVERSRRAVSVDQVVVATTTDPSDDPIERLCAERGYPFYRGSQHDVLDRYYRAAQHFGADVVVRITADCPVIDPDVIARTIAVLQNELSITDHPSPIPNDFAANRLPPPWDRTLPIGLDVEVVSFAALERAWKEADRPFQREHVMPYFYEGVSPEALKPPRITQHETHDPWFVLRATSPRGVRVAQLHHSPDYGAQRWTVDTPADLALLRQIYARFDGRDDFTWLEVLALFEQEPTLAAINADIQHKTAFDVDQRAA
jgi:spore coat polysaccharide biosynthesis protein SpsF